MNYEKYEKLIDFITILDESQKDDKNRSFRYFKLEIDIPLLPQKFFLSIMNIQPSICFNRLSLLKKRSFRKLKLRYKCL